MSVPAPQPKEQRAPLGAQSINASPAKGMALLSPAKREAPPLSPSGKAYKAELFKSPLKSTKQPEPLTDENPDRYTMFPIKFQCIWEFYKKAEVGGDSRARNLFSRPSHARSPALSLRRRRAFGQVRPRAGLHGAQHAALVWWVHGSHALPSQPRRWIWATT